LEQKKPKPVFGRTGLGGKTMPLKKSDGRVVESATEARQAEPGPSILLILVVSVVLAATILGALWFIFFRT
jgi:hypothetical protein